MTSGARAVAASLLVMAALGAYVALEERHVERKVAAVQCYASQHHRRYANEEFIRNLARVHGTNVNREYAEVFQVYRIVT